MPLYIPRTVLTDAEGERYAKYYSRFQDQRNHLELDEAEGTVE